MKPGEGAGYALADIAEGIPAQTIRERWQQGHYGKGVDRPTPDMMRDWLAFAGRI